MSSRIEQFVPLQKIGTVISPKVTGDSLNIDTIDEETTDSGVTIEGVLIKDSEIDIAQLGELDNQSFTSLIKNGDFESWSAGASTIPDGWTLTGSGASIARDATNKKINVYGAAITVADSVFTYLYQNIQNPASYANRTITIGGWLKTSVASRLMIAIYNGTTDVESVFHTGSGNWEWLSVTTTVSASPTTLRGQIRIQDGAVATFYGDGLIVVEGSIVPAFSPKPLVDDGKTVQIDSNNNATGFNTAPLANADATFETSIALKETTTPSADAGYGKVYTKSDNVMYFQDGAGVEHAIGGSTPSFKGYAITTQGLGANPDVYAAGYYEAPAADADLTQASLTQPLGTANKSEAAHAFLVASAAGTTDGSDLVITVTGISITEAGVRNASDSEVIVADATAMSTGEYFETTKKWLGQVTYTLSSTAGATYAATFNYGFAKYEDFGNRDFKVTDFEVVGFAGSNDTGFDVILFHHSSTGWTYSAAGFVPGGTKICQLSTDHSSDDQLFTTEHFAYKRSGLNTSVSGSTMGGVVVEIITTANNAIEFADIHIGVEI